MHFRNGLYYPPHLRMGTACWKRFNEIGRSKSDRLNTELSVVNFWWAGFGTTYLPIQIDRRFAGCHSDYPQLILVTFGHFVHQIHVYILRSVSYVHPGAIRKPSDFDQHILVCQFWSREQTASKMKTNSSKNTINNDSFQC